MEGNIGQFTVNIGEKINLLIKQLYCKYIIIQMN